MNSLKKYVLCITYQVVDILSLQVLYKHGLHHYIQWAAVEKFGLKQLWVVVQFSYSHSESVDYFVEASIKFTTTVNNYTVKISSYTYVK